MKEQVLIVGGGPVGLVNALGLARAGINVTILEAEDGVVESPRAMGYPWSVLDGLDLFGLLDDMKADGFTTLERSYRIFKTGEVIVHSIDGVLSDVTDHPYNLHLGQDKLAKVVLRHLHRYPNVTIHWGTTFTALSQDKDSVTVKAESANGPQEFQAGWVIGADGARSQVRRAVGLSFDGITWPHRFVATNVYYDFDKFGWQPINFVVDPKFGAVVGKLDANGLWRVTYSEDASLPVETVAERIPEYMRTVLPGDKRYELALYSGYNMHQRAANSFRVGRVLLAGDSAHATNPTSGFGLVGGLYDCYVLSEALAAVIRGQVGEDVLDRYSELRRKVFLEVASPISTESKRLVFHSDDPLRLEQDLIGLRERAKDPQSLRANAMSTLRLETPSLVTGLMTAEVRKRAKAVA
jgi:2-polyprenyl-6-methoxyphenol hydroxylase-like FAD-dependent oxidoreductase